MNQQIAVIGECMIEVKPHAAIGFGGDTLNTSVYMSRLGVKVSYVTALGDDPMSSWMLKEWRNEGIDCDLIRIEADAVPGLYLIDVDDSGERTFYYWRDQSPAKRLFDNPRFAEVIFDELLRFKYLYLSGITLAIYSEEVRERLYDFLDKYRNNGGQVLFDNNYRPRQWSNKQEAREAFEQMYRRSDIAMPTVDDEILLFGDAPYEEIINRLKMWGVGEIVLKQGADGCTVATDKVTKHFEAIIIKQVVDTTAAGDSFNAGYLTGRLTGLTCAQSAKRGNQLAAVVVQNRGAIIPKEAMPILT